MINTKNKTPPILIAQNNRWSGWILFGVIVGLMMPSWGWGQTPPSADSLQRDLQRTLPTMPPPLAVPTIEFPGEAFVAREDKTQLMIKRLQLEGVSLLSPEDIIQSVQPLLGRTYTFNQLTQLTDAVRQYYQSRGYYARAILPPQEIVDGLITIRVIESRLTTMVLEKSEEINRESLQHFIGNNLELSKPLEVHRLRHNLAVINELPGVQVSATLQPTHAPGTYSADDPRVGDITVYLRSRATATHQGVLVSDNFGGDSTGKMRTTYVGAINNPGDYFDQITPVISLSERTQYGLLGYNLPVGYSGLRAQVGIGRLNYRLAGEFAGYHGYSQQWNYGLSWPAVRQSDWSLTLSWSGVKGESKSDGPQGNINHRLADNQVMGIALKSIDKFLGMNAETQWQFSWTLGKIDYSKNAQDLSLDQSTAKTQGRYQKFNVSISRKMALSEDSAWLINLAAQTTRRNLPSSEKFGSSGSSAVRGYAGEASGDEGVLMSAEYLYTIDDQWLINGFVDRASLKVDRKPWDNAPNNRFVIQSVGVGFTYEPSIAWAVKGEFATPLGKNRRAVNGKDADGDHHQWRSWVRLEYRF